MKCTPVWVCGILKNLKIYRQFPDCSCQFCNPPKFRTPHHLCSIDCITMCYFSDFSCLNSSTPVFFAGYFLLLSYKSTKPTILLGWVSSINPMKSRPFQLGPFPAAIPSTVSHSLCATARRPSRQPFARCRSGAVKELPELLPSGAGHRMVTSGVGLSRP